MSRIAVLVVLLVSFPASAAIIYEPVQFQFGDRCRYYYGGTDPSVHRLADSSCDRRIVRDAEGQLSCKPAPVYTDCHPRLNAALYGWSANDAKNPTNKTITPIILNATKTTAALPNLPSDVLLARRFVAKGQAAPRAKADARLRTIYKIRLGVACLSLYPLSPTSKRKRPIAATVS